MDSSQIRAKAREALDGKWGKVALIMLIELAIIYAAQLVGSFLGGFLSIAITICSVPIEFGILISFMKVKRNEEVDYADFLKLGFQNFGKSWAVVGQILLKIWPWLLGYVLSIIIMVVGIVMLIPSIEYEEVGLMILSFLLLIVGVIALYGSVIWMTIRSLLYSLANFIAIDNPQMTAKQAVEKSAELMNGNRWKFFVLDLSFIGWAILNVFTFGIGTLWLNPYMYVAEIIFYEQLAGKNSEVEAITEK